MKLPSVVVVMVVALTQAPGCVRGTVESDPAEVTDARDDVAGPDSVADLTEGSDVFASLDAPEDGVVEPDGAQNPDAQAGDGTTAPETCVEACAGADGFNAVFVTVETVVGQDPALLTNADALCNGEGNAHFGGGSYMALLGAVGQTAFDRIAAASPLAQGWVRWDGAPVAAGLSALASGFLWNPVNARSDGASIGAQELALTAVGGAGCTAGHPAAVGGLFLSASDVGCDAPLPCVCRWTSLPFPSHPSPAGLARVWRSSAPRRSIPPVGSRAPMLSAVRTRPPPGFRPASTRRCWPRRWRRWRIVST